MFFNNVVCPLVFTWIVMGILDYNLIIDNIVNTEPKFNNKDRVILFIICIILGPISLKRHFDNTKKGN
jgi:hypothetical protein